MWQIVVVVVLCATLLVVCYLVSQSKFHTASSCIVSLRSMRVDDLPEVNVDSLRDVVTKQSGLAVTGTRFSETDLDRLLPDVMAYLRTPEFLARAHALIGFVPVSTLIFGRLYEQGDHIDWHYDQNMTTGRKYTGILNVHIPKCNTSHFEFREPCSGDVRRPVQTEGTLFVYPGNEVFHHVTTQIGDDESCTRFVIIFGFSETRQRSLRQHVIHTLDRTFQRFLTY